MSFTPSTRRKLEELIKALKVPLSGGRKNRRLPERQEYVYGSPFILHYRIDGFADCSICHEALKCDTRAGALYYTQNIEKHTKVCFKNNTAAGQAVLEAFLKETTDPRHKEAAQACLDILQDLSTITVPVTQTQTPKLGELKHLQKKSAVPQKPATPERTPTPPVSECHPTDIVVVISGAWNDDHDIEADIPEEAPKLPGIPAPGPVSTARSLSEPVSESAYHVPKAPEVLPRPRQPLLVKATSTSSLPGWHRKSGKIVPRDATPPLPPRLARLHEKAKKSTSIKRRYLRGQQSVDDVRAL